MITAPPRKPAAATRRTRALVVAAAVLAAVAVWVIAVPVLGVHVTVPEQPGSETRVDLELVSVIVFAALSSLAGWALLALLERFTTSARTIWTAVALVVFAATLPYLPGFTLGERTVLGLAHTSLALILILGLRRTAGLAPASREV